MTAIRRMKAHFNHRGIVAFTVTQEWLLIYLQNNDCSFQSKEKGILSHKLGVLFLKSSEI